MSDYLWDRTGEPDAETARLETLLGSLKYVPRALELPADATAHEPRAPRLSASSRLLSFAGRFRHAHRLFAPAALAAALLLASLLAASVFMRVRSTREERQVAARAPRQSNEEARTETHATVSRSESTPSEARKAEPRLLKNESVTVRNSPAVVRRRGDAQVASLTKRGRAEPVAEGMSASAAGVSNDANAGSRFSLEAMRAGGGASALVESTRLATKEQLIYALRLTGAKLRDVRQKAQRLDGEKSFQR